MTVEVEVNADAILEWAQRYLAEEIPEHTPEAIANALNAAGDQVLMNSVDYLMESTGLDAPDVRNAIEVKRATASNLSWSMDASAITLSEAPNWQRPWETPDTGGNFQQQQLLQIVSDYLDCCEKCTEAIAESPWTVEDINKKQAEWKDWQPPYQIEPPVPRTNLLHPNCRCYTVPWNSSRRLNVNFSSMPSSPPVTLTARDLGEFIATELRGVLKVRL